VAEGREGRAGRPRRKPRRRPRSLKGVTVTFPEREVSGLSVPLFFIGSPRSIPSLSSTPSIFLSCRAFVSDGGRFRLFALLNHGKSPAEKTPQPLTGETRTRLRGGGGKVWKKMIKMTVKGRTGENGRRRPGIQREDNAVSNVRGITMRRLRARGATAADSGSRPLKFTATINVFVRSVTPLALQGRKRAS